MERLSQISYYLRESPMLAAGLCMILLVLMFGVLGPIFVDTSKAQPLATTPRLEPSWEHPFGTDDSGRDLLSVMVVGVPLTMRIGLLAGTVRRGRTHSSMGAMPPPIVRTRKLSLIIL